MHWAARAFLWIVTVPSNLVTAKSEQYRSAPDAGSIIVKDDAEEWAAVSPDLKGFDAQFDMRAIRQMIDAGAGMPPHWRGEATDVSLATAQAMEHSASRHLRRRQLYTRFIIQDLANHRIHPRLPARPRTRQTQPRRHHVNMTDIDRVDNRDLADASHTIAQALEIAARTTSTTRSDTLRRLALRLILRFGGEQLDEATIDQILDEAGDAPGSIEEPAPPTGENND